MDKGVPKGTFGVGMDYEERRAAVDCDPLACTAMCRVAIDKNAKKFAGK